MKNIFFGLVCAILTCVTSPVAAQQNVWVQIAAERNLSAAQSQARSYAGRLQNVNGFKTSSGWYGIALGPFSRGDADQALAQLRATGQIPGDSYIAFSNVYRRQFWPVGAATLTAQPIVPITPIDPGVQETPVIILPIIPAEETKAEARQSERNLSREERELLQTAMKWDGYYKSAIDGDFGPGTRAAMSAWQDANRYEATGILTSKQRVELMSEYTGMLSSIGIAPVFDRAAGIEINLPTTMVEFDRYDPPFAHYPAKDDSGVEVILISQTGDEATLRGLYDIMQTLEIVPLEGAREIGKNSFTLTGSNSSISSYTFAKTENGHVKGFSVIWPAGNDRRRTLAIDAMRASFTLNGDAVLPDVYGDPNAAQSIDLLAGLAIRKPDVSRSGFYVNEIGAVITTSDVINSCERITLDELYDAELIATDASAGLSLLRPLQNLSPPGIAAFLPSVPRLNTDVAVSGYSYEGILGAPTLTFGTLADLRGLKGEDSINRLALAASAGDAGGPVFDVSGSVMGMLLPKEQGTGRQLPSDVSFAANAGLIIEFLSNNGISPVASDASGSIAPEDLTITATDMTVLVSCWN